MCDVSRLVAAVEQLKRTPVKRHHSTGDMLDERARVATTHSDSEEEDDVRLRLRKFKPRRPKSEGSFIVEGFIPRRASSFGVSKTNTLTLSLVSCRSGECRNRLSLRSGES